MIRIKYVSVPSKGSYHITATYCLRSTPVNWSRLGRNRYATDTYLPSSYSRSENLFRTRSIATSLVTALKFHSIRCVIMLCHFGRTRNGYLASYLILLSSTAASSATSGYVVVPERSGQTEEPAGSNEERTSKKPIFVPKVDSIDAIVIPSMQLWFSMIMLVYFA